MDHLLKCGAKINAKIAGGYTALHFAAMHGTPITNT